MHQPQPSDPAEPRLSASIEHWKRRLLDLTKRNRALNFRATRVSTVAIVDEQPAEVFRLVYLRERAMKFKAAPEAVREDEEDAAAPAPALPEDPDVEEEDAGPGADFVPYDASALDERHTDEWLQTAAPPEALDRSLRRLDEQARLSIEEQGVNTLFLALGMLHYVEAADPAQTFRAPIVLLPVELSRKSARSGYTIRAGDDEPIVNPALAEYLRLEHGIALPALPDSASIPDDYDLQTLLSATSALVAAKPGWSVKADVHLGLFSFQKFVMYKDLEANADALRAHPLVRQLVTREGSPEQVMGLPDDVRCMELDRDYPPERTFQVVDADSSQLRAIAAVARGHDLVIEGPPGTGKSQTITNLIAGALAAGKSVLFVAEKMAALSVVHDRLQRARLGEFCLELHSTKANKRAVMRELAATLDASIQTPATPAASARRLPQVRAALTEYARAVHEPFGALGASPFHAYGELGRVLGAPRVKYAGPVDVAREQLDEAVRELGDLAAASSEIGMPARHPWRDAAKTFYSEDDLETARETAERLVAAIADVTARAEAVRLALDFPPIATFADVETAAAIAAVVARSPGAPPAVLASEAWNQPPAEATALVQRGQELERLTARVAKHFVPEVEEQEHAEDIAYVERKGQGIFGFLAFLDGRYRAITKRWTAYRRPSYGPSMLEQASEMRQVDRLAAERRAVAAQDARGRELFGALWQGERSDWAVLEAYVRWVVEMRGLAVKHGLSARALEVASRPRPDVSAVEALASAAREAQRTLADLRAVVGWPADYMAAVPVVDIAARARQLADAVALGPRWAAFEAARRGAAASLAGELVPLGMGGEVAFGDLTAAFLRAFWLKWLTLVVQSRPALERFSTMTHEERVREFRELDRRVLQENQAALVGQLRDRVQQALREPVAAAQMPFLRRELTKQRNIAPLRRTMREAGAAVRAIKPCLMMSPLTAAQLLDGSAPSFDLVIFDEASQLPPEDAVGAIGRGRQLAVVGDPKQLPPTNFFAVTTGAVTAPVGEDGQPLVEDSESILEEYMGAGVPMSRLRWHYRSAHESLISFSNVQFYDADLHTFPSVETGTERYGLHFEHIPDGVYEGKGLNAVEARRVADETIAFAKEQLARRGRGEREQSLGVGTFNLRQQLAILDELEQRRRDDPSVEPFFDRDAAEPFFVKNLENIQGDERDVIFISVTYARAADGRLRYNFGPLNGENGWRRLNVLTTRARQRMRVFSSMKGDEINPATPASRGATLLREFLLYAERGRLESISASHAAETESPFERDVLNELTARGLKVVPQVGVAGYRIDLGVLDDAVPGRFLCGIECDGVAYHESQTARDRDRLRQEVLEQRGWTILRLWSTDWFKDRAGAMERLLRLVAETRERVRHEADADRDARARAEADAARRTEEEAAAAAARREREGVEPAYVRPAAAPYSFAPGDGRYAAQELLDAPVSQVVAAIGSVVAHESPVHETDVLARVAGMWDTRLGARITAHVREALAAAERSGAVRRRGVFLWGRSDEVTVRSRAGTRIPAERIAPEEYRAAVLRVLAGGHGFSRAQLVTEVRSVLGYGRTGAALDEAVTRELEALLAEGAVGEASTGIRLRR